MNSILDLQTIRCLQGWVGDRASVPMTVNPIATIRVREMHVLRVRGLIPGANEPLPRVWLKHTRTRVRVKSDHV